MLEFWIFPRLDLIYRWFTDSMYFEGTEGKGSLFNVKTSRIRWSKKRFPCVKLFKLKTLRLSFTVTQMFIKGFYFYGWFRCVIITTLINVMAPITTRRHV